jgi:hypothetical protein
MSPVGGMESKAADSVFVLDPSGDYDRWHLIMMSRLTDKDVAWVLEYGHEATDYQTHPDFFERHTEFCGRHKIEWDYHEGARDSKQEAYWQQECHQHAQRWAIADKKARFFIYPLLSPPILGEVKAYATAREVLAAIKMVFTRSYAGIGATKVREFYNLAMKEGEGVDAWYHRLTQANRDLEHKYNNGVDQLNERNVFLSGLTPAFKEVRRTLFGHGTSSLRDCLMILREAECELVTNTGLAPMAFVAHQQQRPGGSRHQPQGHPTGWSQCSTGHRAPSWTATPCRQGRIRRHPRE